MRGEFELIDKWLQENIYSQGKIYNAQDLCQKVTGEKLNPTYLIEIFGNRFK